jgi:hypothetical protein
MATASEIRDVTSQYASGQIDARRFQDWFLRVSLGNWENSEARELSNSIEGLLAEASHAGWSEVDIREELANAMRHFESRSNRVSAGLVVVVKFSPTNDEREAEVVSLGQVMTRKLPTEA